MLAIWAGITYQIGVPAWLDGAVKLPIVTAVRANGTAVMMTYPLYRLVVLGTAIVDRRRAVAVLNRTRIGMMIRAGVDDRAMLSASGINVHMVFAVVFAIGAGLAGFAGVVGGSALSIAPGEDVRYLLASLVVVIVGGMGSITGAAIGALLIGLAEQIGLVYPPTYGIVLTFVIMVVALALRPQGIMGTSAYVGHAVLALDQPSRAAVVPARFGAGQVALAAALLLYPAVASDFFVDPDRRLFAHLGLARALDDDARRLWRHGQSRPDHDRRRRRLHGRNLRHQQHRTFTASAGRGGCWCRSRFCSPARVSALIGAISVRTEGIYTIMITLAIAAAFFYFAQQNYALFNGHSGLPAFTRRASSASTGAIPCPFYYLCLLRRGGLLRRRALLLALHLRPGLAGDPRQRAAHARARLQRHRAQGRRLLLRRRHRGTRRRAARLVQRARFAGHDRRRRSDQCAGHRGDRRAAPSDRAVSSAQSFVILIQTFAIDIVGAERYNTLIGLVFLAIVFVSPDGLLGLVGKAQAAPCRGVRALPPCRGKRHFEQKRNPTQGGSNELYIDALLARPWARRGIDGPVGGDGRGHHQDRRAGDVRGPFTILGDDSMRGALMAVDDFGGKVGGKKIEIIKGSSDGSPDSAVRAARKLVEQDGVKVLVGPLSGDEGLAVKDYAKTKPDVTFVNGTSAAQDTTLRDPAPNFFRFSTDGAQWMAGLGDYAYNAKKYKKVATVGGRLFVPLHAGVRLHGASSARPAAMW